MTRGIPSGRVRDLVRAAVAQAALLGLLTMLVDVGVLGWVVAALYASTAAGFVIRAGRDGSRWGPADRVTLARVVLAGGVVALVPQTQVRSTATVALVVLAALALVLDGVDGTVARRTGTASTFGARFDMETDASLIFVLSCRAALVVGWWVLLAGLLRYVFLLAGQRWTWLRAQLPPSARRKVVAALQGVVLTVVSSGLLPIPVAGVLAGCGVVVLVYSFGVDAVWLWRRRNTESSPATGGATPVES